jgi:hypothetical protein
MGPVTYALCYKSFLGLAMWSAGLCAFPPLFSEHIDLNTPGTSITKSFRVSLETSYRLAVDFEFPSNEARLSDQIVGDRYSEKCRGDIHYEEIPEVQRGGLGQPIPFRVVIRTTADHTVVLDRTFVSLCVESHDGNKEKTRTIGGWLPLAIGDYVAEITNLEGQSGLQDVKTKIYLSGARRIK